MQSRSSAGVASTLGALTCLCDHPTLGFPCGRTGQETGQQRMQELTFHVKGSSAEPYEVIIIKDGDSLTALCSCPAGPPGNCCKPRIGILAGTSAGIVSDNTASVPTAVGWLSGTDVEAALTEVRAAEKAKDKAAVSSAKRKLARAMNS